jgi:hypothetical protein
MRRVLIQILAVALIHWTARSALSQTPWYDRPLVGMEIGPTGAQFGDSDPADARFCKLFDGREIVRQAFAAHCQYLVLWARDGDYAYYNSKLLPKAPGLRGRDPLRDGVAEAHKNELPIIAYCVVQQNGHFLDAHPQWQMRDAQGKPINRFCLNSGYLEAMKQIVAEQLAYGIDGFHIDMLDQGFGPPYGCWCDSCRKLFEKEFGHPMPLGPTWDASWDDMLEFRYRTSERFEKALYAYVKSLNPRASVDFNYHGNPPFSFEVGQRPVQHAGNADFVTGETGVWGFSALGVGLNAEFYRAATPGRRFQVAMQRGVRMYHDQTTRPLNDIRWELFTLSAHGAFVTIVDKTAFDGALDPEAYDRIGRAFEEARQWQPQFGQKPVFEVGLFYSSRSRDWMGREDPLRWMQSFLGAQKAMAYEHLPYGVVLDENATPQTLAQFPIILLPNAGILCEREASMFRKYCEGGGNLIVTGQSGQFDHYGKPLANSVLEELIGAKTVRRLESEDNWVRLSAQFENVKLSSGLRGDWPFLVEGPATVYEPTSARPLGDLLKPFRTTRQRQGREGTQWPMSPQSPVGPAVLINRVGKGSVLTLAASPDFATAGEHPVVEDRKLLANAVRLLDPSPRIQVRAPTNVEAVVTDDRSNHTLRVHLIGYLAPPQSTPARNRPYVLPGLIEDPPLFRATITVRDDFQKARALNTTTVLRRDGNQLSLTVNDIHEVVVIEY